MFWERNQPDIITGWNTEFFDIPYLCNRIKNICGDDEIKRLSPWGGVSSRNVFKMGRNHQLYDIQGIAHLDYFDCIVSLPILHKSHIDLTISHM